MRRARPRPANLARERLDAFTKGITVLAIGPGLGQSNDTAEFCIGLLRQRICPLSSTPML